MTARSTAALLSILAVLLLPHLRERTQAQAPQAGQSNQPTFRSRADAVWLTAFITDENGRPVRGLTSVSGSVAELSQDAS